MEGSGGVRSIEEGDGDAIEEEDLCLVVRRSCALIEGANDWDVAGTRVILHVCDPSDAFDAVTSEEDDGQLLVWLYNKVQIGWHCGLKAEEARISLIIGVASC